MRKPTAMVCALNGKTKKIAETNRVRRHGQDQSQLGTPPLPRLRGMRELRHNPPIRKRPILRKPSRIARRGREPFRIPCWGNPQL